LFQGVIRKCLFDPLSVNANLELGEIERLLVANGAGVIPGAVRFFAGFARHNMKKHRATAKRGSTPNGALTLVRRLIEQFGQQRPEDTKISVADFLRLLSLMKEMEEERGIDEIRVKWVAQDTVAR